MKVFLALNGPLEWQTGIESGFADCARNGVISSCNFFYFEHSAKIYGVQKMENNLYQSLEKFDPNIIIFFHVGNVNFSDDFFYRIRKRFSNALFCYDEGDIYGGFAKPLPSSTKKIIKLSDLVSIRGMGEFSKLIERLNKNWIYVPHQIVLPKHNESINVKFNRSKKLGFVGNRYGFNALNYIRRLPGASGREKLIKKTCAAFTTDFHISGKGWGGISKNINQLEFFSQANYYSDCWATLSYEHYPGCSYYFSDRLPTALFAGSTYICHEHVGYSKIFQNSDFVYTFRSIDDAIDLIRYVFSLSEEDLYNKGLRAREFSLANFHPNVVWNNFLIKAIKAY
jgi:hypothetical protein